MQPKFTQKKSGFFFTKIIAIALIFSASTQFSFAQQNRANDNSLSLFEKQKAELRDKPLEVRNNLKASTIATNDVGINNKTSLHSITNRPEAICATFTGSLAAGDPTMAFRLNRNLVQGVCPGPKPFAAPFAANTYYDTYTWTNTSGLTQCGTFTLTSTDAACNIEFGVYNGSFDPTNLATNFVSDPGVSSGTPPVASSCGYTVSAGQTLVFVVFSPNALGTCTSYTLTVDLPICSSAPCAGTPAPGNTIASVNPVGPGSPLTLSLQNATVGTGVTYQWQISTTGVGGPYTNIVAATGTTYNTSQIVASCYRCNVTCGANTGTSTPVCVAMNPCGWSSATVVPVPILDAPAVTVASNLYTFGGVSNGAVIATSYKFNGIAWSTIAPVPAALEFSSACTDGTSAYILGGALTGTGAPQTTMRKYNPSSNSYTTLAPFSVGTWNQASVVLNCKIYKFGGTTATASADALEIYDIPSNTWSLGANMPQPTSFPAAFVNGGFIYCIGGLNATGTVASLKTYRYDPATNTWDDASIADLPATRWGAAGSLYNSRGVVAGGYVGGSATANISTSTLAWDPGSNTWSTELTMSGERARMTGAVLNGAFYVIGGRSVASAAFNGENSNQRFACTLAACSGTPAPGNTVGPCSLPCPGEAFTLSLQNNPAVSGLTYQWQSSTAGIGGPYADIAGATGATYTTTLTATTWYRCLVSCGANTATSNPVVVISGQGIFTSQPANATILCGGNATFSTSATGAALTWQWEYKAPASLSWLVVPNSGIFSGATTTTLTLTNVPATWNGYQFRAVMQGICTATDFSSIATLTVTPIIPVVNPASATICAGTVQPLSLTNSVSAPTTVSFSSGPISIAIPDGVAAPTLVSITVSGIPAGAVINNISVHKNMTHTYPADMVFNLKGPAPNTNILSLYKHNTNTDNGAASVPSAGFFDAVTSSTGTIQYKTVPTPFRYGITAPTGPFAADALNGVTNPGYVIMDPTGWVSNATNFAGIIPAGGPNGVWTMAMCDGGGGDFGTLTGWSIDITYVSPLLAQGIWTGPAGTMWNNLAANIPYTGTPATTIYVNPAVSSNYSVSFTTATPCTSSTTVVPVTVVNPVTAVVNPTNKTVCVGGSTSFSVSATGGPITYQWQLSIDNGVTYNNISGATAATLNLSGIAITMNNYKYRAVLTAVPCGSVTSAAATLTVNVLPTVTIASPDLSITPGQTTTITGTSTPAPFNATSWSWTLNGSPLSPSVTGNIVTVGIDAIGTYRATVTDVNGCVNSSNNLTIGAEASDRLWIYPNPNNGTFQIRLYYAGSVAERRVVRIYKANGQLVAQKEFDLVLGTPSYMRMDFDLPRLAAGTYAAKVSSKFTENIVSGLFIIQ